MSKIPQLKKKISSFLTKEDGKISKENLIKVGVLLTAVAVASLKMVEAGHSNSHTNNLGLSYSDPTATGSHSNSHSSHSSHGSHGSHGSY